MKITAEEASTQFLSVLDQMTDGEPVTITRQGVSVAKIVPVLEPPKMTSAEAVDHLLMLRKGVRLDGLTIREMIDEGRRHSCDKYYEEKWDKEDKGKE